jgi:hypothetical protein
LDAIAKRFPKIFKSNTEASDPGLDTGTGFAEKYKWLIFVDTLAGGDVLKWNAIFDLKVIEFFIYVNYWQDKMEHEKVQVNKQMARSRLR